MSNTDTQFKPGNKLGKGRPKGSKNKLSFAFTEALCQDFEENGLEAIQRLRENSPGEYSRVIASILPKDINLEADITSSVINAQPELSTEEWEKKHKP